MASPYLSRPPPTPSEKLAQSLFESCPFKAITSTVIGFSLGAVFGLFMSSFDNNTNPDFTSLPTRVQIRQTLAEMGKRSLASGKSFALVAGVYAGTECCIESYRAKNDLWNSGMAGCLTGAALGWKGGAKGMAVGCGGFAAFSVAIDYYMQHRD